MIQGDPLQKYHQIWLDAHPARTAAWLLAKLADGFDIHHVDGNHLNDDPRNLVLIEHQDHMVVFHGNTGFNRLITRPMRCNQQRKCRERGQRAYALRALGKSWPDVAREMRLFHKWSERGMRACPNDTGASHLAKMWAQENGAQWPIPIERNQDHG